MKQFEFKRFALVLWRELATSWKMLAAYAILSILSMVLSVLDVNLPVARENMFYTVTVAGAVMLASRVLSNIWNRRRCISTFSLPAAAIETFVARYLLWLFIPLWFALNMILFREWYHDTSFVQMYGAISDYRFTLSDFWRSWDSTYVFTVIMTHFAMLGGAFFNRLPLLKTAIVGFALVIIFSILANLYQKFSNAPGDVVAFNISNLLWVLLTITVIGGLALSFNRFRCRTVDGYKR